jgi:type IV pilus assembly protein PilA
MFNFNYKTIKTYFERRKYTKMKNLKKKGFTIVELVIVIAVIAVLAAVLIPTFVNLTRKANVSADTVLAKNLNTALAVYDAENDIEDFDDVLEAIKEHGYKWNPETKTLEKLV